eukprot:TRINITY_DN21428_c0_g3_i1.p1 TRINITY_DN21428_c0_g3~~TRINITY_DN21428_c0_g3_i1.p1  ORF type:complete len:938 (-),score=251.23 TRINITY_DN21428_c0_g3_i1:53-2866(-)
MSRPGLFASGGYHGLVVTVTGQLITWGGNSNGQVGDGTIEDRHSPLVLRETGAFRVGAGQFHSLLITDTGELWAWGLNESGRLTGTARLKETKPVRILDGGITAADGGWQHTLALTAAGEVLAWGGNEYGQLGDGTLEDRRTPTRVFSGAKAVAAGKYHSVALTLDGDVYAWGFVTDENTCHSAAVSPVRVALSGIQDICAGGYHSLALSEPPVPGSGGYLFAWGGNDYGQLGDNSSTRRIEPVEIASDIKQASAGSHHSLAVSAKGELFVWGYMFHGRAGKAGKWKSLFEPSYMAIEGGIHSGHCGCYHTVLLNFSGEVLTFGGNMQGQLGNGETEDKSFPRVMLKAGTIEIVTRADVIAALMKAPEELDAEAQAAQEAKVSKSGEVTLAIAQPGLLPPRYCDRVLMKTEANMITWEGGVHPQGYKWWDRNWKAEPNETGGLVRPGDDKPGEGEEMARQEQARKIDVAEKKLGIATERLEKAKQMDEAALEEKATAAAALKQAKAVFAELEAQEQRQAEEDAFAKAAPKRGAKKPPSAVKKGAKKLERPKVEAEFRKCDEDYKHLSEVQSRSRAELIEAEEEHKVCYEALRSAKGDAKLPELLDLMVRGESDRARKIRLRVERQREARALKAEEEAFRKQLERVKKAAKADPRLMAMKVHGPPRVHTLSPYSTEELMLMFKSCLGDVVRSSVALRPGETKWIKDKALYQLLKPVWTPLLMLEGMLLTHWPRNYSPPEPHANAQDMPWRLNVLGIDSDTWYAEELEDMRDLSKFGRANKIHEGQEWLISLFGTEGTDKRFHFPKPYGALPPMDDAPPPPDDGLWYWEDPPDLLLQIADMGLGAGANSPDKVSYAGAQHYCKKAGPPHPDLEATLEELQEQYFHPLADHEGLREFKLRVCEGLALRQRLGFPVPQDEIQKHFDMAEHRLCLRETLGFR